MPAPAPSILEINGRTVRPQIGSFVEPDGWRGRGEMLVASDWDEAQFRIPTSIRADGPYLPTPSGYVEVAVNVEITGRTLRWRGWNRGGSWVRVRIEFVGDGEPSTFSGGWMIAYAD